MMFFNPLPARFGKPEIGPASLQRTITAGSLTVTFLFCVCCGLFAQEDLVVEKDVDPKRLIPISLTGYSGEVQNVLRFDLEIAGFQIVSSDTAQFHISGSNNAFVEGRVTDQVNKATLLAKRYEGGTPRSQAHAFADDIVLQFTGKPGVAQTKIAFKGENGGRMEIYIADYDGANARPATQDNVNVAAPSWAPGGKMLVYMSRKSGDNDIYSHDLSSGQRKIIANYSGSNMSPAVSPDGRRVAMIICKDGNPELYVCDPDAKNLKRLTQTAEDESSPCWSPDSRSICVVSRKDGAPRLYVVPATGGSITRIRTTGVGSATEPEWSPDGTTIAFTALSRPFQVCVVPAQGGNAEVLAAGEDPSWASNSRTLVFARRIGDRRVLSLLDVKTKRVKTLDRYSGSRSQPSWAK